MRLSYFAVCIFAMSTMQTSSAFSLNQHENLQLSQVFENKEAPKGDAAPKSDDAAKAQREQVADQWKTMAEKVNKATADHDKAKAAGEEAKVKAAKDKAAAEKKKYQDDM